MHLPCLQPHQLPIDHRGARRWRFMESADIGSAFRETFVALRANLRRGLCVTGELYALEMDGCIPGQLLDTIWLPQAAYGAAPGTVQAGAGCAPHAPGFEGATRARHALLRRLLRQPGAPALVAWVGEHDAADGSPVLRVEIASADALHAAEHLVCPGRGWRRRDLLRVQHQRCAEDAVAR